MPSRASASTPDVSAERPEARQPGERRRRRPQRIGRQHGGRRVSVATRLAGAVVMVSALAIAVTSIVGLRTGIAATDRLIEQRLSSVRSAEQFELRSTIENTSNALRGLAASPMTAASIDQFSDGFRTVELPDRTTLATERDELADHSAREVIPQVAPASEGPVGPRDLLPGTDVGVHLQRQFLPGSTGSNAGNGGNGERAADVDDPGIEGAWAAAHTDLHPYYRTVAARLGVADLYLVDGRGDVVYSVDKAPDFATNLRVGPQSGSTLATTFRRFLDGSTDPVVTDLSAYPPAGARPTWFHAAPVTVDGEFVGMVAIRLGVEPLNEVLAASAGGDLGVGATGEVYVAGADARLRSDPRRFRESPTSYADEASAAGTLTAAEADLIGARGSTALVQRADGDVVRSAASGATDILRRNDHLGRDALMTATPLGVDGLDWVIVVQLTHAEAVQPVDDYRRILLVLAAVLVALVTFGGVAWANRVVRPIRVVSERLRGHHPDPATPTGPTWAGPVPPGPTWAGPAPARPAPAGPAPAVVSAGCEEFERLVAGFTAMDTQLELRRHEIAAAHDEWLDVLRALLPPAVALRIDDGDRAVLDRVPAATVAVVILHHAPADRDDGSGDDDSGDDDGRAVSGRSAIDRALAIVDAAAERHGVERVKLVGDSCFTAVGHQQPVLDHARRAIVFAHELIRSLDHDPDAPRASIGIASGPVNVGLSGSARLVYDVWGATVAEAYALARRAAPATVIVDRGTATRAPADLLGQDGLLVSDASNQLPDTNAAETARAASGGAGGAVTGDNTGDVTSDDTSDDNDREPRAQTPVPEVSAP